MNQILFFFYSLKEKCIYSFLLVSDAIKSEISLVHEIALKRNMNVEFLVSMKILQIFYDYICDVLKCVSCYCSIQDQRWLEKMIWILLFLFLLTHCQAWEISWNSGNSWNFEALGVTWKGQFTLSDSIF